MAMKNPISEINTAICKMVGVDPDTAIDVTIKLRQCEWPEVTVKRIVMDTLIDGEHPIVTGDYVLTPAYMHHD